MRSTRATTPEDVIIISPESITPTIVTGTTTTTTRQAAPLPPSRQVTSLQRPISSLLYRNIGIPTVTSQNVNINVPLSTISTNTFNIPTSVPNLPEGVSNTQINIPNVPTSIPSNVFNTASNNTSTRMSRSDQVLQDNRIKQGLAQLSISAIDSQFPAYVALLETILPSSNPFIEYINREIQDITLERYYPDLTYRRQYITEETWQLPIHTTPIAKNNYIGNTIYINNVLSAGTTQGTVYNISLYKNSNLHYVQNAPVPAIMKKSPIYNINKWKNYVLMLNSATSSTRASLFAAQQDLNKRYNDLNNPAYVDAVGAIAGSRLVERGLSCFFALCYGTLRAYDSAFFPPETVAPYGLSININFPVQLTLLQPLNGSLADLSDQRWFINRRGYFDCRKFLAMFAQVVFGLNLAQQELSLVHNDFHSYNLLYEQVPEETILYYRRRSTGAYYAVPSNGKIFKMIDFGRSYLKIASTEIGSTELQELNFFASPRYWDLKNFNNDLVRIVNYTVYKNLDYMKRVDPNDLACFDLLNRFIERVLTCKANTNEQYNIINAYRDFVNNVLYALDLEYRPKTGIIYVEDEEETIQRGIPNIQTLTNFVSDLSTQDREAYENEKRKKTSDCQTSVLAVNPFANDSGCNGGIPSENIVFFEQFRIQAPPSSAKVIYLID
jgi:hypothetical protein